MGLPYHDIPSILAETPPAGTVQRGMDIPPRVFRQLLSALISSYQLGQALIQRVAEKRATRRSARNSARKLSNLLLNRTDSAVQMFPADSQHVDFRCD